MLPKGPYGIKMEDAYIFKDLPSLARGYGTRMGLPEKHLSVQHSLATEAKVSVF